MALWKQITAVSKLPRHWKEIMIQPTEHQGRRRGTVPQPSALLIGRISSQDQNVQCLGTLSATWQENLQFIKIRFKAAPVLSSFFKLY